MELPHEAAAVAASLVWKYSSLELACCARRYASPKTGPRTARETAWLKAVPRAMAEGLTGGRSDGLLVKFLCYMLRRPSQHINARSNRDCAIGLCATPSGGSCSKAGVEGRHTVERSHCDGCVSLVMGLLVRIGVVSVWETRNADAFVVKLQRGPAPDMAVT
jgi:hypothetical protein